MQTAQAAPPPPAALPHRPAKWLPLIGLLAVMTFVTLGGFLFSGSTGTDLAGEVEVGSAVEVAQGVTIQPASGWEVAGPIGDPTGALPGIVLEGGNGRLLVGVPEGTGSPEELVSFYASSYLEPQASQLSVGDTEPVTMPAGPAAVAPYVGVFDGVAIEGEVIAIVSPSGTGVALDGWTSQGTYGAVQDQVVAMATSVGIP